LLKKNPGVFTWVSGSFGGSLQTTLLLSSALIFASRRRIPLQLTNSIAKGNSLYLTSQGTERAGRGREA